MSARILIPLPSHDFDPTETAVPWKILHQRGHVISFATPLGKMGEADARMVTGRGLGPWGALLKADAHALSAYQEMIQSSEFQKPLAWADLHHENFDALVLPGGHAPGMKEYLESSLLQKITADFFAANKVVGAICHGTVLAARSKTVDQRSVLWGRKTTALLRSQELAAWLITALWLKNYYRTYPETVESEVKRQLKSSADFVAGPWPLQRDSLENPGAGFVVEDGLYISARWPGDAHCFGLSLARHLQKYE